MGVGSDRRMGARVVLVFAAAAALMTPSGASAAQTIGQAAAAGSCTGGE